MSAAWCFTAWNIPMTRPNCSRTLAYSLAMVTHVCRATRRLGGREETTEHDRSVACAGEDAIGGRVGGQGDRAEASGRVGVRGHGDGDLVAGGDHEIVAAGKEEQIGEPGAEHEVGGLVEPDRGAGRTVGEAGQAARLAARRCRRPRSRPRPRPSAGRARARSLRPTPRPRSRARRTRSRSRHGLRAGGGRASRGRPSPSTPPGASPRARRAATGPRCGRRCARGTRRRRRRVRGGPRRSRCPWVLQ